MAKVTIGFRTDPEIKNELLEKANALGISLSDYCENSIVNRSNKVDENGFSEPLLTDTDMTVIGEIVEDQLHSFFQDFELKTSAKADNEMKFEEHMKEPQLKKQDFDLEDFLKYLDLPEKQAENLAGYVKKASEALEVSKESVLAKMLAYSYSELAPKKTMFLGRAIGQVEEEKNLCKF
jgi:hypothetical protein